MDTNASSSTLTLAPSWCSFHSLPSDAEACVVASRCLFSLATLEVAFTPDSTKFAVVERMREQPEAWRWAVYSCEDLALEEGHAPSVHEARIAAGWELWRRL
jgi:hypothetical protein